MQVIEIKPDATGRSASGVVVAPAATSWRTSAAWGGSLVVPPTATPWHMRAPWGGNVVRVILETGAKGRRQTYRAYDEATGEVLVDGSRDPEHDVARILFDRGHVGLLETQWRGSTSPAMRLDIETTSRRSVLETGSVGPVASTWRPFDPEGRLPSSGLPNGGDFAPSASVGASQ